MMIQGLTFFFLFINLLHNAQLQSMVDYLELVVYNLGPQETETPFTGR